MSFSAWLGLDISIPNPTWTIPTPSYPVAFTSFQDIGPYVFSATLQSYHGVDIPSRLRIYSDSLTLEEAADLWEKKTGNKIERKYSVGNELQKRYEEIKPTLQPGMLGPAIPCEFSVAELSALQRCSPLLSELKLLSAHRDDVARRL